MDQPILPKPPRCRLGKCHPQCLQSFQNIQNFTFFLSIFAVMSGMLPRYLVSQITAIEKHFEMPSQRSGIIISAKEIGFLLTVVFVGHFLNKSNRPRVLAACAFTIGVSSLLMTLPFFIYGTPSKHNGEQTSKKISSSQLCQRNRTKIDLSVRCVNTTGKGVGNGDVAFGTFILAAILSGCGSSGLYSIGIAFIDDNADKNEAALYIGFTLCLRSISPVLGTMFGAGVSRIHVDLQDHPGPQHSSWIGAWWIGFLAIGVIVILSGVPLLFYPKHLPKAKERKVATAAPSPAISPSRSTVESAADEEGEMLAKSFPKSVWKLLRNTVFIVFVIGSMVNVAAGTGFMAFLPKYIESQFHVDTFTANMVAVFPVPVLFGWLLDSLCLVTESSSGCNLDKSELCLVYDNEAIRYSLHGVTFGLRFLCPILYMLCWFLSRNMVFPGDKTDKDEKKQQEFKDEVKEKDKEEDVGNY
ncbi:solute carrier organic anion transporter family member 4C1-like [Lineus longissimus]|uniref:solute carrier organic anion transporter family member 4C1-like n=1 Tax=Lineus longissimus TaxID=88925 RepID=UPI00315E002B